MMCNARSVLPKIDEIRTTILTKKIDVFCCCETWLHENIDNQALNIDGYSVFRCDRQNRVGGGCAVWICDDISCAQIIVNTSIELECVFILLSHARILLVLLYIPPVTAIREARAIK